MCNVIEKVENKAIEKGKELGKLENCFEFVLDGTVSVAVAAKKCVCLKKHLLKNTKIGKLKIWQNKK